MEHYNEIRDVIARVRARWRTLRAFRATVRAALLTSAIVGVALILSRWTTGAPMALVGLAALTILIVVGAIGWAVAPLRRSPADLQVARFIEERAPALDDRLVTAVDVAEGRSSVTPMIAGPLVADAARRARDVPIDTVIPSETLRRAGFQAAAAALVCLAVLFFARGPARQSLDAASLSLWPARVTLEVTPGSARVKAGVPLAIHARLVGNRAPVIAQVQIADGDRWRSTEMAAEREIEGFGLKLDAVSTSFKYRVVAGAVTSPTYDVTVVQPPRVARIDVDYAYPAGLKLAARTESDGGDIYAPAGTSIRLHVFTDRPAATGMMALGNGNGITLSPTTPTELTGTFDLVADNSYRVSLADGEGISTPGDTEYFIRILEDRPPEVRILKPAADRAVTRLEEVDVEVQAEDDYGVDRLELGVLGARVVGKGRSPRHSEEEHRRQRTPRAVPRGSGRAARRLRVLLRAGAGSDERTAPDRTRRAATSSSSKSNRTSRSSRLRRVRAGCRAPGRTSLDELVTAQKEIVVATWKLDRRGKAANGAKSEQDIRSVSRAESELKTRVEETSSTFRESTMRDPRRRQPRPGGRGEPPQPAPLRAGETLPEEDDMTAASAAMGKAVVSLDALKTGDALPSEMEALNHLLRAQAAVKKREVTQQQSGSGSASNRSNVDLSTLFDRELQKSQQTNYETKTSAEQRAADPNQSALDKIKDLARRQDELLKKQQELARDRDKMSEEQLKRELEKLTREQSELRQRAEELARQTAGQNPQNQSEKSGQQKEQAGSAGQQSQGQQSASGQSGQIRAERAKRAERTKRTEPERAAGSDAGPRRYQQPHARRLGGDAQRDERPPPAGRRAGGRGGESRAPAAARGAAQSRIGRARRAPPRGRRPAARSATTRGRAAAGGVGARADAEGRRRERRHPAAGERPGAAGCARAQAGGIAAPAGSGRERPTVRVPRRRTRRRDRQVQRAGSGGGG